MTPQPICGVWVCQSNNPHSNGFTEAVSSVKTCGVARMARSGRSREVPRIPSPRVSPAGPPRQGVPSLTHARAQPHTRQGGAEGTSPGYRRFGSHPPAGGGGPQPHTRPGPSLTHAKEEPKGPPRDTVASGPIGSVPSLTHGRKGVSPGITVASGPVGQRPEGTPASHTAGGGADTPRPGGSLRRTFLSNA